MGTHPYGIFLQKLFTKNLDTLKMKSSLLSHFRRQSRIDLIGLIWVGKLSADLRGILLRHQIAAYCC